MLWGFLLGIVTGYFQYMLLKWLLTTIFKVQLLRTLHTAHLIFIYIMKSLLTLVVLLYGIQISISFMMSSVMGMILIPFIINIIINTDMYRKLKKEV